MKTIEEVNEEIFNDKENHNRCREKRAIIYKQKLNRNKIKSKRKRKPLEELEKKYNNIYCPIEMGCGTKNLDLQKQKGVMIIIKGHSGKHEWKNWNNWKEPSEEFYHHYYEKPTTFHTFIVNRIIQSLEKENISWYLTDLIKCFIIDEKDNNETAMKYCGEYLIKQVEALDPKIIVLFGNDVKKFAKEHLSKYEDRFICDIFPTARTADSWIKKKLGDDLAKEIIKKFKSTPPLKIIN